MKCSINLSFLTKKPEIDFVSQTFYGFPEMKIPSRKKSHYEEIGLPLVNCTFVVLLFSSSIFSCANQSISDLKKHKDSYSKVDSSEALVKVPKSTPSKDGKKQEKNKTKKKIDTKFSLSKIQQNKTDSTEVGSIITLKGLIKGYKKFKRGLKITLSGQAIQSKTISPPNMHGNFIKEKGDGFQLFNNVEDLVFARKGADTLVSKFGTSKFTGSPLELNLSVKALRPGKCTLRIKVEGLGKKKQSVYSSKILYINRPGFNDYKKHSSDRNWDKNYEQFQKRHNQEFLNDTLRRIHKQDR